MNKHQMKTWQDMTDRELLELAAKAAGIQFSELGGGARYAPQPGIMQPYVPWNPLAEDGDALRLVVKCNLHVCVGYGSVSACLQDDGSFHRIEEIKDDPYAATRRAIVRTAAEIGKGME